MKRKCGWDVVQQREERKEKGEGEGIRDSGLGWSERERWKGASEFQEREREER